MKAARHPLPRALLLGLLLAVAAQSGCQGCDRRAQRASTAGTEQDAGISSRPVDIEIDIPVNELPADFEFGPAETEPWLRHAGTVDFQNQYAPTVMIALEDPAAPAPCSGVLVGRRLVLTAGSCVCIPQRAGEASSMPGSLLTAASCVERAAVVTVTYSGEPGLQPRMRATSLRAYPGSVRVHPSLELRVDSHGFVVSRRADLAAIFLEEPIDEQLASVPLARTEVREGETLTMAGYGYDEVRTNTYDVRFFRKNRVARAPRPGDDGLLYEQQGAYVYNGFAGGPCFREEKGDRWLVGIAGAGSGEELSCTSLYVHREWVHRELQRGTRESSSSP